MPKMFEHATEGVLIGEVLGVAGNEVTLRLTEPSQQFDAGTVLTMEEDRLLEREYDEEVLSDTDEE